MAAVAPPAVDFGAPIQNAANQAVGTMQDNAVLLFALPVAWTVYAVVRKIIAKVR